MRVILIPSEAGQIRIRESNDFLCWGAEQNDEPALPQTPKTRRELMNPPRDLGGGTCAVCIVKFQHFYSM